MDENMKSIMEDAARFKIIRELVESGREYCSDTIKVILGIKVNSNDSGTD